MSEIDFITDHYSILDNQLNGEHIHLGGYYDEYSIYHPNVIMLDGIRNNIENEYEFGNGYIKVTDCIIDENNNHFHTESSILDKNHNNIAKVSIDYLDYNKNADDNEIVSNRQVIEIKIDGDLESIIPIIC